MLHEYQQEQLKKEVESFKEQLKFVRIVLKDDDKIKLFMICKAINSINLDLPNVQYVTTVGDDYTQKC